MIGSTADKLYHPSVSFELTEHCNLRCARCDHASPWMPERYASVARYARDIEALSAVYHADEIRFAGGEPLLHPELEAFLRIARESHIAEGIVVLSNGVLLPRLSDRILDIIDCLLVSLYPSVRPKFDLDTFAARAREHGVLVIYDRVSAFRQILVNDPIPDRALIAAIYQSCFSAVNCHTIHEGRYYRCSRAHFLQTRMSMIGKDVENPDDGIDLHDSANLRAELERYLGQDEPLAACAYCLGGLGKPGEHSQLNKIGVRREKEEDHTDSRSLIDPTVDTGTVERAQPLAQGWWRLGSDHEWASAHNRDIERIITDT